MLEFCTARSLCLERVLPSACDVIEDKSLLGLDPQLLSPLRGVEGVGLSGVCLVLLLFYDSSNLFGCLSSVFKMKRLKMLLVFLCTQTRALLCLKSAQARSHPLLQGFKASSWDIQFLHGTNI